MESSSEGNNEVIIEEKIPSPLRTDDESSPDLLKNTPSNIARLEDVIVHCQGRKKYLAATKSPSDGEDVRWYFYKIPLGENELAASIPRTEIVGKGEYFRFSTRDSLALEASFLQREEELLSRWWSEYAECSEGPIEPPISSDIKHDLNPKLSEGVRARQLFAADEERVGVPVKGGLFEVDLVKRHCFPVYWSGENRRVLRGHWFALKAGLNWLPLREDVAEQLEFAYRSQVWHRRTFQQSGLFAARIDLQGSTLGLHALFTGEDDTWEAWLNVDASGFSNMIGIRGNGIKLRRGYSPHGSTKPTQDEVRQQKEEEMDDYCSQVPVRHLVFMVHGIGQRLEKANLVDDVGDFRRITASLAERHLTKHQRNTQRVLFIPCQWRRGLKLGGESTVENITLDGVRGLRTMLSATVHDVLYYMSPIYCQDIINSVSNQLNRLYLKFITRNPGYDGKVSIYAHSLGTVLSYDILCHQEKLSSLFLVDWMHKEHGRNQESQSGGTNLSSQSISLPESNEQAHVSFEQSSEPKQATDSLLSDDDRRESYQCSSDILSERGSLDESTSIGCEVPDGVSDKLVESTSENASDESKSIKFLREEVHSLRARIAELESQCGTEARDKEYQDDKEVDIGTSNQSLPQKLAPEQENKNNGYKPFIKYTKLEFKVDTFFAVGSPLGFFLSLRNIRIGIGKGKDYWQDERIAEEMPACRQMFNIFHPFDPVAYRVEPLVCKDYISKRPILIPYHKGGKRLHIGIQEFTEDLATRSHAVADHLRSMRVGFPQKVPRTHFYPYRDIHDQVKVLRVCQSRNSDDMEDTTENDEETEGRSYGSIMMERLTGSEEGRIDHMLQDKTFEYQYISAIGSHTNYWRDPDTALFILKHLYSDIPTEPNLPEQPSRGNSEDQKAASTGLYYQSEAIDETVPLMFSDGGAVDKEFSGEVKKEMGKH